MQIQQLKSPDFCVLEGTHGHAAGLHFCIVDIQLLVQAPFTILQDQGFPLSSLLAYKTGIYHHVIYVQQLQG